MEGRKNHTIAPHTTKATAALRYITVKPNSLPVRRRAGANHPRKRHLRAVSSWNHRFPPGAVGMLAGKGEHLRVGGRAEAAQEHPNKQQNEIVAVPGKQHAGEKRPADSKKQSGFCDRLFCRNARPETGWTRMPMMALPVKKKPTIAGRAWTSLVRNRLSVGVCNAPAIPVRKATIKNAVDVKSKGFGEAAAGVLCMFSLYASNRERRSLRLSLNKQRAKSRLPQ